MVGTARRCQSLVSPLNIIVVGPPNEIGRDFAESFGQAAENSYC
jgi:hypothetical protein